MRGGVSLGGGEERLRLSPLLTLPVGGGGGGFWRYALYLAIFVYSATRGSQCVASPGQHVEQSRTRI